MDAVNKKITTDMIVVPAVPTTCNFYSYVGMTNNHLLEYVDSFKGRIKINLI